MMIFDFSKYVPGAKVKRIDFTDSMAKKYLYPNTVYTIATVTNNGYSISLVEYPHLGDWNPERFEIVEEAPAPKQSSAQKKSTDPEEDKIRAWFAAPRPGDCICGAPKPCQYHS